MGYSIKKYYTLDNSIAPQMFAIKDNIIYYFDKINKHEGRFYKSSGIDNFLFETDESLGIILENGEMYTIEFDKGTVITEFNGMENNNKKFSTGGIYFDFTKDNSGNYIFLAYENNKFFVEVYNSKGLKINSFTPPNLVFGCGINCEGDYIYIGGIDEYDTLKLIKMNYIGLVENEWIIYNHTRGRIIEKIIHYGPYIIMLLWGKCNHIVVLNQLSGELNKVFPWELKLNEFVDINLYNEKLYILDGKSIYDMEGNSLLCRLQRRKKIKFGMDFTVLSYQYMMYTLEVKDNFNSGIGYASILSIIVLSLSFSGNISLGNSILNTIINVFCFFWMLVFIISSIKGTFILLDKSERIDRLLRINKAEKLCWKKAQIIIGISLFCFISVSIPTILWSVVAALIFSLGTAYLVGFLCARKIQASNKSIIIDLLNEEDGSIIQYVKPIVSKITEKKTEKLYIDILANKKQETSSIILNWAYSRRNILMQDVIVKVNDERIITILDFSKRDIKYSRMSILMDYICFLKRRIGIKKIEIDYYENETNIK